MEKTGAEEVTLSGQGKGVTNLDSQVIGIEPGPGKGREQRKED